ncbi:pathogenesis-related protein 1C-like [Panicum miliaceum]|uniref:Pathogenesis-related protein 1C-like n=1 Tax=Panicum miliaceum TaxID=4540 RepID=A0A3L6QBK8_PANMI|nr:pathogenesis-related protein 1C-like [Panicum miliaceum]
MSSLAFLTVLSLLALAATPPSDAASAAVAPPPVRAPRGPANVAQFLSAINAARADVGVPPLSWNATVAQRAKLHVTWLRASAGCDLSKKERDPTRFDEAMTFFRGYNGRPTPADAVATWLSERPWYNRGADTCAAGQECGNYKLVVAPDFRQLGCALVACPSGGAVAACGYRG